VTLRPPGEEIDRHQAEHARAQASLAAPAELAQAIRKDTTSRGGAVTELDPKDTTRRHYACGRELPRDVDTATLILDCPHCRATFDQDQNAVMNMLHERSDRGTTERSTGHSPAGPRRKVRAPIGVS
jgi:transposase